MKELALVFLLVLLYILHAPVQISTMHQLARRSSFRCQLVPLALLRWCHCRHHRHHHHHHFLPILAIRKWWLMDIVQKLMKQSTSMARSVVPSSSARPSQDPSQLALSSLD